MNNQPAAESSDLNSSIGTALTPEKIFTSQVMNLNSLTPTRQFNPVQNLFDKVKQKIGETQSNANISSTDFEEIDLSKKSKSSPKRNSKKKSNECDNSEDASNSVPNTEAPASEVKQKERTSPRNKKSLNTETLIVISDDGKTTSGNKVNEGEIIDLVEDTNSPKKNSVGVQHKHQDTIDLTTDNVASEKSKPRRGRLLPAAIPSIFLTAPRLLRSELAPKRSNSIDQLRPTREKVIKTKIMIKPSNSSKAVSPNKTNKDKIVGDPEDIDDDILFVSEEVKSPHDGDKPSLKLLIRQKKKSEMLAPESTNKQSDNQEGDSSTNLNKNEPQTATPLNVSSEQIKKTSDERLLRSNKQNNPTESEKDDEVIVDVCSLSENGEKIEKIELESEKQMSNQMDEVKHNLKNSIKDVQEGLESIQDNTVSLLTENNNCSKTMLEQLSPDIGSNSKVKSISADKQEHQSVDKEEASSPKKKSENEAVQTDLTRVNETKPAGEGKSTISADTVVVEVDVNNEPKVDSLKEETTFLNVSEETNSQADNNTLDNNNSDKKLRRSRRSVQQNSNEVNPVENPEEKVISSKASVEQHITVSQEPTTESVNVSSEMQTPLRKSVRSVKFKNVDNNNDDGNVSVQNSDPDVQVAEKDTSTVIAENDASNVVEETKTMEILKQEGDPEKKPGNKVSKISKSKKIINKKSKNVTKTLKSPQDNSVSVPPEGSSAAVADPMPGMSKKRKSVSDKSKRTKQKTVHPVSSNESTVDLNVSEASNVSLRSLRSRTSSPYLAIAKSEVFQNNKENKSKTKSPDKIRIKIQSNTVSTSKNVLVQPSVSNVQPIDSKNKRSRSSSKTSKAVSVPSEPTSKNKRQQTVEANKTPKKTNAKEAKNSVSTEKQKKVKVTSKVKEVSSKRQSLSASKTVKVNVNSNTPAKNQSVGGKVKQAKPTKAVRQVKGKTHLEKLKMKSVKSKKILANKKNVKDMKSTITNKAVKSEMNKKQSVGKVATAKTTNKAEIKRAVTKSLKKQDVMRLSNKSKGVVKKNRGGKVSGSKKTIKVATRKGRFPLKVQNIVATRSKGTINVKDNNKKKTTTKEKVAATKTTKKSEKHQQQKSNENSSRSVIKSTPKSTRSRQSLVKGVTTVAAAAKNQKQKPDVTQKSPVAAKSKNIKKSKSVLIFKKKKLLIEKIIKSTLKQLDVQKQIRKSSIKLKVKAQLQRKQEVRNIMKAAVSNATAPPTTTAAVEQHLVTEEQVMTTVQNLPLPSNLLSGEVVQADSSVVDLHQDPNETIIFLTSNENCLISELPVMENVPENIICLEVNDQTVTTINKDIVADVAITRRSSRVSQRQEDKNDHQETTGRRKRRLNVPTQNEVLKKDAQRDEEEASASKVRKVVATAPPNDEDLSDILSASEAVLRNIEQVTNTTTPSLKKKPVQTQKGKDLTVFDFNESDPEPETVPLRFKSANLQRSEEQSMLQMDVTPEDMQQPGSSAKKSPMKQATILEMFNRVVNKNQKTGFTVVKSLYASTPKVSSTTSTSDDPDPDIISEQLREFQRKCMKIDPEMSETPQSKKKVVEAAILPTVYRGLQRKCLQIHNRSLQSDKQSPEDVSAVDNNREEEQEEVETAAPTTKTTTSNAVVDKIVEDFNDTTPEHEVEDKKPVIVVGNKKTRVVQKEAAAVEEVVVSPKKTAPKGPSKMPPPTRVRVAKKNANPDMEEVFDEDDSRSEWMPQELAEYKFNYSAKRVNSYKPVFKCKVCLAIYPTYYKLSKHKQKHIHTQNPYACKQCDENFNNVEDLVAHIRIHKGQHPYVCQKCDEGFWSKKAYDAHMPLHLLRRNKDAPKKFECDICKKKFAKLCDVERHSRVHTGEKPYVCNICNKRFQQSHNLSKHLLIHLHLKPFNCEICGKKFGRIDVLNRHVLTHSLIKPFKCCLCTKDFIRISQLNHHYKKEHPDFENTELASQFGSSSETDADVTTTEATIIEAAEDQDGSGGQTDGELLAELEVVEPSSSSSSASSADPLAIVKEDEIVNVVDPS